MTLRYVEDLDDFHLLEYAREFASELERRGLVPPGETLLGVHPPIVDARTLIERLAAEDYRGPEPESRRLAREWLEAHR